MRRRETFYISSASDIEAVGPDVIADDFIGIYWTLPAPGRLALPTPIDEAATASFTIKRQRHLVSAVATRIGLKPLAECALQFSTSLEWTEELDEVLADALARSDEDTVLISVDFQAFGWRTHHALRHRLRGAGLQDIRVSAGMDLDVADHFALNRHWDERHRQLRKERRTGLKSPRFQPDRQRLDQFHEYMRRRIENIDEWQDWSLAKKAEALNARALWTVSGLRWNVELVRDLEAALRARPD
ncbi:hypothetical protein [Brevundimonas sp.]|uniref:hypothetical protein n=1 Tax=Brevundimonas sp. TaxID=1871086 RepID=UPI001D6F7816|nr:hypothetical protein [Brevundimonas sp.]MBL0947576.1 hypothetical protein [Brevundimonas sp.]